MEHPRLEKILISEREILINALLHPIQAIKNIIDYVRFNNEVRYIYYKKAWDEINAERYTKLK